MNHHAIVDPPPPAPAQAKTDRTYTAPALDFLERKMTGAEFQNYLGEIPDLLPDDLLPALEDDES